MTTIPLPEVAVLDLAGTTISDEGLVLDAFFAALRDAGIPAGDARCEEVVRRMGESKITVFLDLFDQDLALATHANQVFEAVYAARLASGLVRPVPGARDVIVHLQGRGVRVALTTGFSPKTRDALLDAVGWRTMADLTLSPADVGRGRPFPDLALAALMRLGGSSVKALLTAGDTIADVRSGLAAGAGTVIGVLTGTHGEDDLHGAGAHLVLPSISDLPALLTSGDGVTQGSPAAQDNPRKGHTTQ
ncbi:MAG: HAD hydrolase-like protein [Micrococcales bacterium]|nr:HAD hydrolase-like protein [Micrococcales bacterium]